MEKIEGNVVMQDPRILDIVTQALDFYNQQVNQFALDVWSESLKGFTFEQVSHALNLYIQRSEHGRFAPKPADIVLIITGGNADAAAKAWSKVNRAIKSYGPYRTIIFNDPIIHRVVYDLGGWTTICGMNEKEFSYLGHEFQNRYKGYKNRGVIPVYPSKLVGIEENSRVSFGLDWRGALEIVGDQSECLAVFKNGVKPDDVLALESNKDVSNVVMKLSQKKEDE